MAELVSNALVTAMTRKDEPMDWNQIETKWAVMARRIRADVKCGKIEESVVLRRRVDRDDAGKSIVAKENAAVDANAARKPDPVSTR